VKDDATPKSDEGKVRHPSSSASPEVSVLIPCLNEAETLPTCIRKAQVALKEAALDGEIVVADNGSTDGSPEVAKSLGARVVHVERRGYGAAYQGGLEQTLGRYIVIGDADDSYDFGDLNRFVQPLRSGYDAVIGSRLRGTILPGAMPWLNRYIGNPVLTWILNLFFHAGVSDAHCGMRAFSRDAYLRLNLVTTGMEFASEMIVKMAKARMRITEIPIVYYPDGRSRRPHLRPFRDGWRHLRFMLLYSPKWLFLIPGALLTAAGLSILLLLAPKPVIIGGVMFDVHSMVVGMIAAITGSQVILTGLFAKVYAHVSKIDEDPSIVRAAAWINLERALLIAGLVFTIGFGINFWVLLRWIETDFTYLHALRPALVGATLMGLGIQGIFGAFFLSMLGIEKR
jgi:glycosyltransferase involved in cell wall biosynthesis